MSQVKGTNTLYSLKPYVCMYVFHFCIVWEYLILALIESVFGVESIDKKNQNPGIIRFIKGSFVGSLDDFWMILCNGLFNSKIRIYQRL
jgi:hypothetical protein